MNTTCADPGNHHRHEPPGGDTMAGIEVRYRDHEGGGGSVWVRSQNRYHETAGDWYSDEWVCVWSTQGALPGHKESTLDDKFRARTRAGIPIANPYAPDSDTPITDAMTAADPVSGEVAP